MDVFSSKGLIFLHTCTPCSKLPSNISAMIDMGGCFQTKNIVERKKIYKVLSLRKNKRMKERSGVIILLT